MPPDLHRSGRFTGRIDEDATVAFALATNDPHDLYGRGLAVPPLFTASLILPARVQAGQALEPLIRRATKGVHGEHDTWILQPLRPNMSLQWQATLHALRRTRGGITATYRIPVTDEDGRTVVEHYWTNLALGVTVEEEMGDAKPTHTFPEEARRRPLGTERVTVDRDQTFRYAGVSGDHVGHAIDDEVARQEGYPGKILQGLCTFSLCSRPVTELAAGGDPRRIRRLACRFSRPAFPNRDLLVDVYDAGELPDGARSVAFEARQDGVTVIRHGRAEIS